MANNSSRFFQLNGALLFEYEFNEKFNVSRSDKYGEFPIGKFSPFVFNTVDGTKQYVDTNVYSVLPTNNVIPMMSVPMDSDCNSWFKIKGNTATYKDYSRVMSVFGVKNTGMLFTDADTFAKATYDSVIERIDWCLEANGYSEMPAPKDINPDLFCLFSDNQLRKILLGFAEVHKDEDEEDGYEFIFRYYADKLGIDFSYDEQYDIDVDYKTAFSNLYVDYHYYDDFYERHGKDLGYPKAYCDNLCNRIKWAAVDELYAFYKLKEIHDFDEKLITADYTNNDNVTKVVSVYDGTGEYEVTVTNDRIPFDTVRVYFVGGYFISDDYGFHLRVGCSNESGDRIVLLNTLLRKEMPIKFKYLDTPLYLSNRIYDKCIEFRVPSVKFLSNDGNKNRDNSGSYNALAEYLDVDKMSPIRIEFSSVLSDDVSDYSSADTEVFDVVKTYQGTPNLKYDAIVFKLNHVNTCALPQYTMSDNLSAKIEVVDGCVRFCGMWDGTPMSWDIAKDFNKKFSLYDIGKRHVDLYHTGSESTTEWMAYHEITAKFFDSTSDITDGDEITPLYTERYNFTQVYSPYEQSVDYLKYRPIIEKDTNITSIKFEYNYRLINVLDDVQFLRQGSCTVDGYRRLDGTVESVNDYFTDTVSVNIPIKTYNVFNRIENITQELSNPVETNIGTKYTKVFYSSNSIVLDSNGEYNGDGTYTLKMSNSPKNYKFTFRKYDGYGNLTVLDMSDSVYKLYSRDANGCDIIIEPTYSSNMNAALGEIEFNVSINNIQKLKGVDQSKRFMSIVVVNQDNTISTMFDFTYE